MVHLQPMPGAAGYGGSVERIMETALSEASIYREHGFDAIMLENMHDAPYLKGFVEPETTAAMAVIAARVKAETNLPLGIQLLAGANLEGLAAAIAASADFIRVEGYVFAHVGDEGVHESSAAQLIRRRWSLQAERIKIFADIKKKHSAHAITGDITLADTAKAAEFFKADGVIVTGAHTGDAPPPQDVEQVRNAVSCHVLVGSGVDVNNVHSYMSCSDAIVIGSAMKLGGNWANAMDTDRIARFIEKVRHVEHATA